MSEPTQQTSLNEQRREPAINLPMVIIGLIAVMVLIHGVDAFFLTRVRSALLTGVAAFIPGVYGSGAADYVIPFWYYLTSPFTYSLLHGSWMHLGVNCLWLAVFGAPLAARIGAARFLLFFFITAGFGAFAHYLAHTNSFVPMVGASGAISGCTAAAARFAFKVRNGTQGFSGAPLTLAQTFTNRSSLIFIIVWFAISLLSGPVIPQAFGGADNIAWEAHIGGFLAGLILLPLFDRREQSFA
jgi:membrane associated rhomboid family serine protease